jgi:hypothetical protein
MEFSQWRKIQLCLRLTEPSPARQDYNINCLSKLHANPPKNSRSGPNLLNLLCKMEKNVVKWRKDNINICPKIAIFEQILNNYLFFLYGMVLTTSSNFLRKFPSSFDLKALLVFSRTAIVSIKTSWSVVRRGQLSRWHVSCLGSVL